MQPLRHRRLWLGTWLAMVAAVVVVSLVPPPPMPAVAFEGIDKVEHVLGYFVLSALGTALFVRMPTRARIAAGLVAMGIGLEIAQGQLTATRTPDVIDAVANTVGVLLGLVARPVSTLVRWTDARIGREAR